MGRFGERVSRVDAHLSDVSGQDKSGDHDIHSTLQASLAGLNAIAVKDHAGSAHQAIEGRCTHSSARSEPKSQNTTLAVIARGRRCPRTTAAKTLPPKVTG